MFEGPRLKAHGLVLPMEPFRIGLPLQLITIQTDASLTAWSSQFKSQSDVYLDP